MSQVTKLESKLESKSEDKHIELHGFQFYLAGHFYHNPTPSKKSYKWDGESKPIHLSLELLDRKTDAEEELAYLVTVNGHPAYVGEFSYTLRDRWLKTEYYTWHHKDHLIDDAIKNGDNIELWLLLDSIVELPNGVKLNISKSVEHHLLKNQNFDWNKRNN